MPLPTFNPLRRLESKARAAIKNSPEVRRLDRKKLDVQKRLVAGKLSGRQAAELKFLLRLRRKRFLLRAIYRLMRGESAVPA